jgi:hypothetical protein
MQSKLYQPPAIHDKIKFHFNSLPCYLNVNPKQPFDANTLFYYVSSIFSSVLVVDKN